MAKTNQTETLSKVIGLLTPLSSEERHRIVQAALTFLGEKAAKGEHVDDDSNEDVDLPVRVRNWLKQSGLRSEQLQQVFHIADGKVEVIASEVPGSSVKEKTVNAYVLAGLAKYITTGEMKFDDKSARAVCSNSGCYDNTNHSTYLKAKANLFTGTKDAGWALTAPGLKHGGNLVKVLTKTEHD